MSTKRNGLVVVDLLCNIRGVPTKTRLTMERGGRTDAQIANAIIDAGIGWDVKITTPQIH